MKSPSFVCCLFLLEAVQFWTSRCSNTLEWLGVRDVVVVVLRHTRPTEGWFCGELS